MPTSGPLPETDLMNEFPIHCVTTWPGNTPAVALKHYAQVRDEAFSRAAGGAQSGARAAQIEAQTTAARIGQEATATTQPLVADSVWPNLSAPVTICHSYNVGVEGREAPSKSACFPALPTGIGAESGAVADADPLAALVASLTPDQRRRLAALLLGPAELGHTANLSSNPAGAECPG